MSIRIASLIAPLALLSAANLASAQHHGGGGAHMGGAHMGGIHSGGVHPGGFQPGVAGYRGSLNNYGYRGGYYNGLGFGAPYYGGLGYPYGYPYGGITLGFGAGGLGYGYGMGSAYSGGYRYAPSPMLVAPRPSAPIAVAPLTTEPAAAVVTLTVPEGSKVWFDDKETPAPGGKVTFTSPVMKPGASATLNIKARWNDSTREMSLPLRAGDKMAVDLRNQ